MKTYEGWRDQGNVAQVRVVKPSGVRCRLKARLDLASHSPTGFEWGYAGSGPAQLALALLADVLRNDSAALALHQAFKFKVITPLVRMAGWTMSESDVLRRAADVSELPILRLPDGSYSRTCCDCVSYLHDRGMLRPDPLGIFDFAAGVTLEQTRAAVRDRHREGPQDFVEDQP